MSIVVAVRVRPFNQREKDLKSKLCVRMKDNTTVLIDENGNEKVFSFDHSFWSHDGYEEDPQGYLKPISSDFADQKSVYEKVGRTILDNALNGYNCTLFAYGQTGSGKSFSMVGFGKNKGIVPISTEELFEICKRKTSPIKRFEINLSMLEIYNEKIQDLLISVNDRTPGGLKVRESKTLGVYVEDLSKHPMGNYQDIENKMAEGFRMRTIASTQMNSCSSRAHTIITIEFKQIEYMGDRKLERLSVINLVDLAGSEKVAKSGAVGDRLKEGCSINKSLTVLGLVITNLADISMGKGKGKVVPYRDSSLTRILQNALGGNSKTLMICAISPSSNNYEESVSTLRYADQAKRIKCHAVINESESDSKLRELQRENDELKRLVEILKNTKESPFESNLLGSPFENDESKLSIRENFDNSFRQKVNSNSESWDVLQRKINDYEKALKSNQMVLAEYEKSFEERLSEENQKKIGLKNDILDLNAAYLSNMNEDAQLTGQIIHNLDTIKILHVGRKNGNPVPHIILNAIGIQSQHARIEKINNQYFIFAGNKEAQSYIFINGDQFTSERKLSHLDRICFGISTFFIFKDQKEQNDKNPLVQEYEIDWEFCQQEVSRKNMIFSEMPIKLVENARKSKEEYIEFEKETFRLKNEYEEKMEKLKIQHEEMIENLKLEALNQTKINDQDKEDLIKIENEKFTDLFQEFANDFQSKLEQANSKKEQAARDIMAEFKEKDKEKLEHKLLKLNPNITELNLIAHELKRNVFFSPYVTYVYVEITSLKDQNKQNRYKIKIKVDNREKGYSYLWDLNKFSSRYFLIKDVLHKFYDSNSLPKLTQDKDPFWDPPEPQKFGECYLKLLTLAYLLDNQNDLVVLGDKGPIGMMSLNLLPVNNKGEPLDEDNSIFDEFVDDPQDLKGSTLHFQVQIKFIY